VPENPVPQREPTGNGVDTLYYDGQCPLCAAEIDALRDTRGPGLALVDIHEVQPMDLHDTDGDSPPTHDELLRTLHLRRADGEWLKGADANVAAWEGTRRGRILRALRWPLLRPVVDRVYALWARWRYRRLYGS
jgi:predicted DCC family thiol-disulfide oxidoreductase YuxK